MHCTCDYIWIIMCKKLWQLKKDKSYWYYTVVKDVTISIRGLHLDNLDKYIYLLLLCSLLRFQTVSSVYLHGLSDSYTQNFDV